MPVRCLHKNGDSSERDTVMKKIFLRKRERPLQYNKENTCVSSHHAT